MQAGGTDRGKVPRQGCVGVVQNKKKVNTARAERRMGTLAEDEAKKK